MEYVYGLLGKAVIDAGGFEGGKEMKVSVWREYINANRQSDRPGFWDSTGSIRKGSL
jgi:hypothetical protein